MRLMAGMSGFFGFGLGPVVIAKGVSAAVPIETCGAALGMTNIFAVVIGTALMPLVGGIVADQAVGAQILMAGPMIGVTATALRLVGQEGRLRQSSSLL